MSLYTGCMQCSMYPESSVVDDDVCTGTLFNAFLSWYSNSATSNKRTWENCKEALEPMFKRINAYILITHGYNPPSYFNTCTIQVDICYMCVPRPKY